MSAGTTLFHFINGPSRPSPDSPPASLLDPHSQPLRSSPRAPPDRPAANEEQILSSDSENNYYQTVSRKMQSPRSLKQVQREMRISPPKLEWIRSGIEDFLPGAHHQQQFERLYRNASHLRLSAQQLGFRKLTLTPNKRLDQIWFKLLEVFAREVGSNRLIGAKLLRKYLRESGFYLRLYSVEPGKEALRENDPLIDRFYTPPTATGSAVDHNSEDFQAVLEKLKDEYFREFKACIITLSLMIATPGFKPFFLESPTDKSFLARLWTAYRQLSAQVLRRAGEEERRAAGWRVTWSRKMKMLISVVKLIYEAVVKVFNSDTLRMASANSSQDNFLETLIEQLEQDILTFESMELSSSVSCDSFTKLITELLLALFPFALYHRPTDLPRLERINRVLAGIRSEALAPIKMLLLDQEPAGRGLLAFRELIEQGLWTVSNGHWKKWVGIFLQKYSAYFSRETEVVVGRIVWVCKVVVANECHEFWETYEQDEEDGPYFYLAEIRKFLTSSISCDSPTRFGAVLPVLTKLMGSLQCNYYDKLLQFVSLESVNFSIFNTIIDGLRLNAEREEKKLERVVYAAHDREANLEQEIKFLCRLVYLAIDELGSLEEKLMDGSNRSTGLRITFLLLRCFQKLSADRLSDLKSLRYIVQALDGIFLKEETRLFLPIAIGLTETSKWSHSKSLKPIIDACVQSRENNEERRQSQKLKAVLSLHLNHIVKLSDSLEQYFPTTLKKEDEKIYDYLHDYINSNNEERIIEFLADPCLKSVPWFYYLLLILEADSLTPLDFETIRLLLLKMRVKDELSKEYSNLHLTGDMINNGKIIEHILRYLTPIIKEVKDPRERYIFGLSNQEYESFMGNCTTGEVFAQKDKYANKMYRFIKTKKEREKEKQELYEKISGSLSIIETLLKLNLEDEYPLLENLRLNKFVIQGLLGNNAHMFEIKFNAKLESDREKKDVDRTFAIISALKPTKFYVEKEMGSSVSLIHTIMSLVDFERRMGIDKNNHPSRRYKLGGVYYLNLEEWQVEDGIKGEILERSRENILTEQNRQSQNIGYSTVLKILQYVILLGHGNRLYHSLLQRNFPTNRYFPQPPTTDYINEFFDYLLRVMTRYDVSMHQKEYVVEFLSACFQEDRLSEYFFMNLHRFRDPIVQLWKEVNADLSPGLMIRLLLMLNLMLVKDPSTPTIKFVRACIPDPEKTGSEIIGLCRATMSKMDLASRHQNTYLNLLWCSKAKEIAICESNLLLYLGVISYLVSHDLESSVESITEIIFKEADMFLRKVAEIPSTFDFDELKLTTTRIYPRSKMVGKIDFMPFQEEILRSLFLHSPCSIIENIFYQPWEIYQKARSHKSQKTRENTNKLVIQSYKFNTIVGLHRINQHLSQFYYILVLGMLQRGKYGFFFSEITSKSEMKKDTVLSINFAKQRAHNNLSTTELLGGRQSTLIKCFSQTRSIFEDIWGQSRQNDLKSKNKDINILVLTELIKTIEKHLTIDECTSQQVGEAIKILDKVLIYISTSSIQVADSISIFLFEAIFQLCHKIFHRNMLKHQSYESCVNYFRYTIQIVAHLTLHQNELIKIVDYRKECLYVAQLVSLILQRELFNMDRMETMREFVNIYIENPYRCDMQLKIRKILECYLALLENMTFDENFRMYLMQIFNRAFFIDSRYSKNTQGSSFLQTLNHNLMSCLQKIAKSVKPTETTTITFLVGFVSQMAVYNIEEYSRSIVRIVKICFEVMTSQIKNHHEIRSLSEIVLVRNIFSLFGALGTRQNWQNAELEDMLNNMLLAMQDKAARFEWVRIVPASAFELQLTKREVVADKMDEGGPGSGKNIFELFSILRLHEYCKSYILFFISSIKHSQLLFSLCDKTFNSGSLDEMTWERLKMSLMSAIAFYEKFSEYLTPKYLQQTILVNSSICQDGDYIDCMGLFLAYFESYDSVQDLGEDILQNIFLLHHAIILFLTVWKRYDWKSRIDWKHPRKELLTAYLSLLKRYDPLLSLLAPNDAPEAYPAKLKKMQDKMKEELELNERTA